MLFGSRWFAVRVLPPGSGGPGPEGGELAQAAGSPRRRLRAMMARVSGVLGPAEEREFGASLDHMLSDMLPILGAVFGIAVILFSAWDYWIAPEWAGTTAMLRLSLVLVGSLGYANWSPRVPVAWRCALVYVTHTGAMILSSAALPDGLVLALPAITGVMFPLALVEPRLHRIVPMVLLPSLLFAVIGATVLQRDIFIGCLLVYLASLLLMVAMAVSQGRWRRGAFLAERALAYAARHDSLSGALARGYLVELANHDVALAKRYDRPLAICMIDIDHFKRVNDSFGHSAGDALLCEVSRVCAAQLRASDYLGRIGGEEFVCVMPETTEDDALGCAERMRLAVAAVRLETPSGTIGCTISIGIASLRPEHAEFSALLAAADAAMYHAKSTGRDRTVLAPPHSLS